MNYLYSVYYIYANMDKNSKFLLTMICLIILLLFLILVISIISKNKQVKKFNELRANYKSNNTKKKINYEESVNVKDIKPSISISPVIEDTKTLEEEMKEEKIEVIPDTEIIETIDETDDEIEEIKKLIENNIEQDSIKLNEFEKEQEENAIISYDELVKKAGAKKIIYKSKKEETIVKPIVDDKKTKTFSPSQIVSPIYGIQKDNEEKDEVLKSFDEIENIKMKLTRTPDEEMKNDMEFLGNLKKFRSSLD